MSSDLNELRDRLVNDPFNNELRLKYARLLHAHDLWGKALQQYELLLKGQTLTAEVYTGAAQCLHRLQRPQEALDQYTLARSMEGFEPDDELESLTKKARPTGADLRVVKGAPTVSNVLDLHATPAEKIGFQDIAGMGDLKKTLKMQIIVPFTHPGLFAKFKKKTGGGILLYGPPGCGKTMMAQAIATECNAYFMAVGIIDVLNMWMGESERNLAHLFEKARFQKPSVLFFDELDALAYSRSKAKSEHTRTVVNEFLSQLDGFEGSNERVLILAATNMPWDVDPAMKRPGRFDRQIFVSPPDAQAREEMFRIKLEGVPCEALNLKTLAESTKSCSGADIDGIIDRAKEMALTEIVDSGIERRLTQEDLMTMAKEYQASTIDWLKTARNLVKYAGADDSYRDVEKYLKRERLL